MGDSGTNSQERLPATETDWEDHDLLFNGLDLSDHSNISTVPQTNDSTTHLHVYKSGTNSKEQLPARETDWESLLDRHELFFNGVDLSDQNTISTIPKTNDSTTHLHVYNSGTNSKEQLPARETDWESLLDHHELFFNGVDLSDHRKISTICETDDSTTHWQIYKPGTVKAWTNDRYLGISDFDQQVNIVPLIEKKFQVEPITTHPAYNSQEQLPARETDWESLLDRHELFFNGVDLSDHCKISTICETGYSTTSRQIYKPGIVKTSTNEGDWGLSDFEQQVNVVPFIKNKSWVEPIIADPEAKLDPVIIDMIESVNAGLEKGYKASMISEGCSGSYFLPDESGRHVGVFKPMDEELFMCNNPKNLDCSDGEGLMHGTLVGQGYIREVAAYILDHPPVFASSHAGFSGVPPTALVRCQLKEVVQIGSLQKFVEHYGTAFNLKEQLIPLQEVQKLAIIDLRFANTDRHLGNILCRKAEDGTLILVPIDHGYCFPQNLAGCRFDWIDWPQADVAFTAESIRYIESLDPENDVELLEHNGLALGEESVEILCTSTMLLKKGAARGFTPRKIGNIMDLHGSNILQEIQMALGQLGSETNFMSIVSAEIDEYLDKEFPM